MTAAPAGRRAAALARRAAAVGVGAVAAAGPAGAQRPATADSVALAPVPRTAADAKGRPADPVNLLLRARPEDLPRAFAAAGWRPARPLGLRSDAHLAEAVLLDRPDSTAPVSTLRLFGRKQDLAFEREVVRGDRRRDHVRLWRLAEPLGADGRAAWAGAATFDYRIGVQGLRPVHHVARHVDLERDTVAATLARAGWVRARRLVAGRVPPRGVDGATGDPWISDGALVVLEVGAPAAAAPTSR